MRDGDCVSERLERNVVESKTKQLLLRIYHLYNYSCHDDDIWPIASGNVWIFYFPSLFLDCFY